MTTFGILDQAVFYHCKLSLASKAPADPLLLCPLVKPLPLRYATIFCTKSAVNKATTTNTTRIMTAQCWSVNRRLSHRPEALECMPDDGLVLLGWFGERQLNDCPGEKAPVRLSGMLSPSPVVVDSRIAQTRTVYSHLAWSPESRWDVFGPQYTWKVETIWVGRNSAHQYELQEIMLIL